MFSRSAEANTSAGAPSVICVTRSDEPAKFSTTFGVRVLGLERFTDLGERRGERRRGEHRHVTLHRRVAGASAIGASPVTAFLAAAVVTAESESSVPHDAPTKPRTTTADSRRRGVLRTSSR